MEARRRPIRMCRTFPGRGTTLLSGNDGRHDSRPGRARRRTMLCRQSGPLSFLSAPLLVELDARVPVSGQTLPVRDGAGISGRG